MSETPEPTPEGVRIVERLDGLEIHIVPKRSWMDRLIEGTWERVQLAGCLVVASVPVAILFAVIEVLELTPGASPLLGVLAVVAMGIGAALGMVATRAADRWMRRRFLPVDEVVSLDITPHSFRIGSQRYDRAEIAAVESGPVLVMRDGRQVKVPVPLRQEGRAWLTTVLAVLPREPAGSEAEVPAALRAMQSREEQR